MAAPAGEAVLPLYRAIREIVDVSSWEARAAHKVMCTARLVGPNPDPAYEPLPVDLRSSHTSTSEAFRCPREV